MIDAARLRELRNTAWTEAGWTYWQRGDPKQKVWQLHQDTGLDDTLRQLVELFGQPEAVAIRRLNERPID